MAARQWPLLKVEREIPCSHQGLCHQLCHQLCQQLCQLCHQCHRCHLCHHWVREIPCSLQGLCHQLCHQYNICHFCHHCMTETPCSHYKVHAVIILNCGIAVCYTKSSTSCSENILPPAVSSSKIITMCSTSLHNNLENERTASAVTRSLQAAAQSMVLSFSRSASSSSLRFSISISIS